MNIDKNKVLNANIKFTINELQHIIIALVMAKKASESLSSMEDVNIGQLVQVHESDTQAILLDKNDCAASIYCTKHKNNDPFYLGERKWGLKTVVTILEE